MNNTKKQTLELVSQNFCRKTGYSLIIGVEQEFYLGNGEVKGKGKKEDETESSLLPTPSPFSPPPLPSAFPFFSPIKPEKGEGQFEVEIAPTDNPTIMAEMVEMLRSILGEKEISFNAKPYPNQPGSAMHVHVNMLDQDGKNLFMRNGEEESPYLEYAIAGLLELMPASMKYFAPYEEAYIRYIEHGMESPSTISWGANNRTVALRLPSVPLDPQARRIEHRVPCADADPYLVIAAIIAGVEFGIVNKLKNKHEKIWGNAFLPQYTLPLLPHSFAEAKKTSHAYLEMVMAGF